ncbi:MAG: hypothetical protein K0Q91_269 [Fibrobacteria bacterium]|jgi:hypothetical protein|nr:hypothetical protein [Fibrobacteria bacterium]
MGNILTLSLGVNVARKTFISYKYNEAQSIRDAILKSLGEDAVYYTGETSSSPSLTDLSTQHIRNKLGDMIFGTTVTIVVVSPNMIQSKWIDWEIEYSLRQYSRGERASSTNGIVGVIAKYNGGYDWIVGQNTYMDGCKSRSISNSFLYPIITGNRYNGNPPKYSCPTCKSVNILEGSYVSLIEQDDFLADPDKYIENAYEKSQRLSEFDIVRTR